MRVDVDFAVWKRLTSLLDDEEDTYSAVIERLLDRSGASVHGGSDAEQGVAWPTGSENVGAVFKGLFLPEGTRFRASHRGKTYFAKISDARWMDDDTGEPRTSPSHAAQKITGNSVNGWLFWLAQRPGESQWHSLDALRQQAMKP